jgi:hypothetical protein
MNLMFPAPYGEKTLIFFKSTHVLFSKKDAKGSVVQMCSSEQIFKHVSGIVYIYMQYICRKVENIA